MFDQLKKQTFSGPKSGPSFGGSDLAVPDPRAALDALSEADRKAAEKKAQKQAEDAKLRKLREAFERCSC